ncbi:putative PEP-CTERM system histidine kinase [Natronocella acetinitrilica]|uniref:histidine kinase n=1 Tax=Natronocella acetinitrilica TaxID=414046 RepID=A0AAE3KE76_9GAMM|nr:XrtA/PEP-CTERM system histidine kinase PrsK [Natronocella acetinitrilica]MCP1677163.1 putative PEP-CTERM system histidine kinase [Natronocella acetinitrilica]
MAAIGVVSYGLCALAFGFLALLLLVSWRGGSHGALLGAACAATALWAALLAAASWTGMVPAVAVETLELTRTALWLGFIAWLLAPMRRGNLLIRVLSILAVLAPVAALLAIPGMRLLGGAELAPLIAGVHGGFIMIGLALALLGVILLEQLYRNLPSDRRWAMKFLCLGVALIFGFDLYLYSDALLFRQLDALAWQSRGAVQALAVPLIAVAARRNQSWALPVFVSRHVAFHTATIVGAGGYLILISLGGYYIRDFGGSWGAFAQILMVSAAAVGLVVVITSGDARAKLRVFLSKHFFSNKYDYREEWLRLAHRLSETGGDETAYERAVHVVADILNSPAGAVWLRRDDTGFAPMGGWRLDVPADATVPEDAALVAFLRERQWVIDMAEYRAEPGVYGDMQMPALIGGMERAWAIVPLMQQERLTGFMVLCRPDVNAEITWEDRDLMKVLGRQVASYLGQHDDAMALSQARQFEAFNQLTAFLMHDLKNLIAQQSLIVKNAEKHKHNPEFIDDALETIGNSVRRMERLLEHLQRRQRSGLIERVDIHQLITETTRRCADRAPVPEIDLQASGMMVEADREEFAMVLLHLIRNAQDATPEDGSVSVQALAGGNQVEITVADTGSGMTAEFIRDELFRPFHTTKSSKGMGIGAHQAREFVHRAGGRVNVTSVPGGGTQFRMTLPAELLDGQGAMAHGAPRTGTRHND